MTVEEARRYHAEYQTMKVKGAPSEYMRYMAAKQVLADHNLLVLTPGQRGFLASVRRQLTTGNDE